MRRLLAAQHSIVDHALLSDDDLLGTVDDEVATLIVDALVEVWDLVISEAVQTAVDRPEHDGDVSDKLLRLPFGVWIKLPQTRS